MSRHTDNQSSSSHGNKSGITIIACEEDPQTRDNSKWSFYNSSSLNKKKTTIRQKRDMQGFQTAICERVICSPCSTHATHGQEEEGGAAPVLRCAGRFPFCLTGGPAAAAGLHSALQLACIFLHVASHSYVSTLHFVCRAERQGKAGGYADGFCVVGSARWWCTVHVVRCMYHYFTLTLCSICMYAVENVIMYIWR
jgi:hypothetical protein